jgi:cytochrome b pre-mRNA-processing protein 3
MSTSTICTSCIRTFHQQTRRRLLQSSKPTLSTPTTPTTTRAFATTHPLLKQTPPQPQSPQPTQASFIASLRSSNNPLAKATTEPYVAYGATEDLFKACALTSPYTIPSVLANPPAPAPKNSAGEDIGVGEGWWFAPKTASPPGLELPVTFNTWAQIMYLHMYALTARLRKFPAQHVRIWEQNLLDHFFYAAEDRMAMWHGMAARGIRNKYLKDLWVQWRGVLVSYDEGLIKGDAVLAGAVWRNVFQAREDVNLEDVAAVVGYLRRELARLDKLSDGQISSGEVGFGSPGEERRVVGEMKSAMMERSFTKEDLEGLKGVAKA